MQVKCAHPKCMCSVGDGQEYCSKWCEANMRDEAPPCACGHAICQQIYKRPAAKSPAVRV